MGQRFWHQYSARAETLFSVSRPLFSRHHPVRPYHCIASLRIRATLKSNHKKPTMQFDEAVKVCFSKYADFDGRADRSEFWWFWLFSVLCIGATDFALGSTVSGVVSLGLMLPSLSCGARRLHDIDFSGWWQLLLLTGIGWFVLMILFVLPTVVVSKYDKR